MAPHLKWNETDTDKLVYRSVSGFLSLLFSLARLWVYWFVPSEKACLYSRWYLLPLRLGTLCGAPDPSCQCPASALMTASLQEKETIFICIYSQTGIKKWLWSGRFLQVISLKVPLSPSDQWMPKQSLERCSDIVLLFTLSRRTLLILVHFLQKCIDLFKLQYYFSLGIIYI